MREQRARRGRRWRVATLPVSLLFATLVPAALGQAASQAGGSAGADYSQIAPILKRNCAGCHNPSGGAPFNLLNYADA